MDSKNPDTEVKTEDKTPYGLLSRLHVELLDEAKALHNEVEALSKKIEKLSSGENSIIPLLTNFDEKVKGMALFLNAETLKFDARTKQANTDLEKALSVTIFDFGKILERFASTYKKDLENSSMRKVERFIPFINFLLIIILSIIMLIKI
jgi:hypothetical protein